MQGADIQNLGTNHTKSESSYNNVAGTWIAKLEEGDTIHGDKLYWPIATEIAIKLLDCSTT